MTSISLKINDQDTTAQIGETILDVLRRQQIETPTLCWNEHLTPVNACRVCMVELKGSRVLVPSCSRRVEAGMEIYTETARVREARRTVIELLLSTIDTSAAADLLRFAARYQADPDRFAGGATMAQPVRDDNLLYVRDYAKCILCYKCVEACGTDAQFTFAIAVAGRGFKAHIDTGFDVPLAESPCVYCGNCIAVCPTGALVGRTEWQMRQANTWHEAEQTQTDTTCPYCGVGCELRLYVQENRIVKVSSPSSSPVTRSFLCVKGRFGYEYVHSKRRKYQVDTPAVPTTAGTSEAT